MCGLSPISVYILRPRCLYICSTDWIDWYREAHITAIKWSFTYLRDFKFLSELPFVFQTFYQDYLFPFQSISQLRQCNIFNRNLDVLGVRFTFISNRNATSLASRLHLSIAPIRKTHQSMQIGSPGVPVFKYRGEYQMSSRLTPRTLAEQYHSTLSWATTADAKISRLLRESRANFWPIKCSSLIQVFIWRRPEKLSF